MDSYTICFLFGLSFGSAIYWAICNQKSMLILADYIEELLERIEKLEEQSNDG